MKMTAPSESSATDEEGEANIAHVSGFTFTLPAGWRQVELSPEQQGFVDCSFSRSTNTETMSG